ncbi:hypothetical protein M3Y96_00163900 [Aphelenchoides besseyi]|nr:hypothetical protein M3Y96_00163900 [Aphelenchoides besseyi]
MHSEEICNFSNLHILDSSVLVEKFAHSTSIFQTFKKFRSSVRLMTNCFKYATSTEDEKCFQLQEDKTTSLHGDCTGAEDLVVTSQLLNVTFTYPNPVDKKLTLTFNFGGCILLVDYSTIGNNAVLGQPNYLPLNFEVSPDKVLVTKQGSASFEVDCPTHAVFTSNGANTYKLNVKYNTTDAADLSGLTAVFKATIFVPNENKGVFTEIWVWVAIGVGIAVVAGAIVTAVFCLCCKKRKEEKDKKKVKTEDDKTRTRKKESKASKRISKKAVQVNSAISTPQLTTPVSSHTGVSVVMPQDSLLVPKKETEKPKEPRVENTAPPVVKTAEEKPFDDDTDNIFDQPSKNTSTMDTTK